MATALQCPECGHRHPLAQLPDTALFRCKNCDRVLKVPESVRTPSAPAVPTPTATTPRRAARRDPNATVVSPRVSGNGAAARTAPPAAPASTAATKVVAPQQPPAPTSSRASDIPSFALPWALRAAVWVVALPVALAFSALFLRVIGVLDVNSAMNVFIGTGAGRFGAVIALVPVWAATSAVLAHVALEGAARVWSRRR